jgi:hypothetical protein
MDFMTREVFDTLVIVVIIIGGALALVRLYQDFTRPLPADDDQWSDDDTQPNAAIHAENITENDEPEAHPDEIS